jgi:hypothetical protein
MKVKSMEHYMGQFRRDTIGPYGEASGPHMYNIGKLLFRHPWLLPGPPKNSKNFMLGQGTSYITSMLTRDMHVIIVFFNIILK